MFVRKESMRVFFLCFKSVNKLCLFQSINHLMVGKRKFYVLQAFPQVIKTSKVGFFELNYILHFVQMVDL